LASYWEFSVIKDHMCSFPIAHPFEALTLNTFDDYRVSIQRFSINFRVFCILLHKFRHHKSDEGKHERMVSDTSTMYRLCRTKQ